MNSALLWGTPLGAGSRCRTAPRGTFTSQSPCSGDTGVSAHCPCPTSQTPPPAEQLLPLFPKPVSWRKLNGDPVARKSGKCSSREDVGRSERGRSHHVSLSPDMIGDCTNRFPNMEPSPIPGIKVVFQYTAEISPSQVLVGIFHKVGWPKMFFVLVLSGFGVRIVLTSLKELEAIFLYSVEQFM